MHEQGTLIQIKQICDKNNENRHETAPVNSRLHKQS